MAVKSGDILRGKYRLDAIIGRGGMGEVFCATDLAGSLGCPGNEVAIKVVSGKLFGDMLSARVEREAAAAARIRSDYVPRVLDVATTEAGDIFLVMERLIGQPLSDHLKANGALPWEEIAQIGGDVLRGLIDAHTAGVVHRDLKPSNVFLTTRGGRSRAMVLDFGICKMESPDKEHLTATGEAIGTVAYMAPEQIRGASRVDDRADLYAFGVMVFEMICRRLPHTGPSQMAILASKLENPAARVRDAARVPFPVGLDELVAKALARRPADRFASAQELLKAWCTLGTNDTSTSGARAAWSVPSTSQLPSEIVDPESPTRAEGPAGVIAVASTTDLPADLPGARTDGAFTAGIARPGTKGRLAYLLAGGGLACGLLVTALSVLRVPHTNAPAQPEPHPATSALATPPPVDVPAPSASDARALPESAPEPQPHAASDGGHAASRSRASVPAPKTRRHVSRPPANKPTSTPKATAPQLTTRPRY